MKCLEDEITDRTMRLIEEGSYPHLKIAETKYGLEDGIWLCALTDAACDERINELSIYGIGEKSDYMPELNDLRGYLEDFRTVRGR